MNDPPFSGSSDPAGLIRDFLTQLTVHEPRIAAVISRFLDDPRDIEEAVQDTFVQAWRHRDEFRQEAALFTWLYRIATNTALMRLRRRSASFVAFDELTMAEASGAGTSPLDDHVDRLAQADRVRRALADLPEHHRTVVLLRDVEGLTNAEAAELLGLPVTTVKAQLHRGRAALRRALHHRDDVDLDPDMELPE